MLVVAGKLTTMTYSGRMRLGQVIFLFKPDRLLTWHRELVRRTWTFKQGAPRGRPATTPELEALIFRLAKENPAWGYGKVQGEVLKLGYAIGRSTIRDVLKRKRVPPAPHRSQQGSRWGTFLRHYQEQIIACDFFTVETAWLKTLYVLFFIELGSRRVHLAGCTTNPSAAWVTQQARHLSWKIQDGAVPVRFLIHDRDTKFSAAFDTVFTAEDVTIILTPIQARLAHRALDPLGARGVPGPEPDRQRGASPSRVDGVHHLLQPCATPSAHRSAVSSTVDAKRGAGWPSQAARHAGWGAARL